MCSSITSQQFQWNINKDVKSLVSHDILRITWIPLLTPNIVVAVTPPTVPFDLAISSVHRQIPNSIIYRHIYLNAGSLIYVYSGGIVLIHESWQINVCHARPIHITLFIYNKIDAHHIQYTNWHTSYLKNDHLIL